MNPQDKIDYFLTQVYPAHRAEDAQWKAMLVSKVDKLWDKENFRLGLFAAITFLSGILSACLVAFIERH